MPTWWKALARSACDQNFTRFPSCQPRISSSWPTVGATRRSGFVTAFTALKSQQIRYSTFPSAFGFFFTNTSWQLHGEVDLRIRLSRSSCSTALSIASCSSGLYRRLLILIGGCAPVSITCSCRCVFGGAFGVLVKTSQDRSSQLLNSRFSDSLRCPSVGSYIRHSSSAEKCGSLAGGSSHASGSGSTRATSTWIGIVTGRLVLFTRRIGTLPSTTLQIAGDVVAPGVGRGGASTQTSFPSSISGACSHTCTSENAGISVCSVEYTTDIEGTALAATLSPSLLEAAAGAVPRVCFARTCAMHVPERTSIATVDSLCNQTDTCPSRTTALSWCTVRPPCCEPSSAATVTASPSTARGTVAQTRLSVLGGTSTV
mmetsp:Transcript_38355/g.65810  ORF Transcript_38355/g.65810 Transcript_38355/m.65810 type:complete len:372 (-) Transcript_38355:1279-2394(-)